MVANDAVVVQQLAKKHEGTPEETLFKVAVLALKAVDAICEAVQGTIDPSLDENMRGAIQ
jgi:hypothetical protein